MPQTFSAKVKLLKAEGAPKELLGRELDLAFQAPARLRLAASVDGSAYTLGRDGQRRLARSVAKD